MLMREKGRVYLEERDFYSGQEGGGVAGFSLERWFFSHWSFVLQGSFGNIWRCFGLLEQ